MPWARLSDDFYDHPKVEALPDAIRLACVGLHILAISWSNRFLTDGVIPPNRIHRLGGKPVHRAALIAVGLWDELDSGSIQIHDFHDYNATKESILAEREAARTRMATLRSRRGSPSGSPDGAEGVRPNNGAKFALPRPDQTRPDQTRPDSVEDSPATPKRRRAGLTALGKSR
jgi:hypothetical protein